MTVEIILTPEKSLFFEDIDSVLVTNDNSRLILFKKNKRTSQACASFTIRNIIGYIMK